MNVFNCEKCGQITFPTDEEFWVKNFACPVCGAKDDAVVSLPETPTKEN